jgi:hypothetical protein
MVCSFNNIFTEPHNYVTDRCIDITNPNNYVQFYDYTTIFVEFYPLKQIITNVYFTWSSRTKLSLAADAQKPDATGDPCHCRIKPKG